MSPVSELRTSQRKEAEDFSNSEAEVVDVMDTLQHAISIIEKETAKNLAFLPKEIGTRNTNKATVALVTKEDLNVNSLQQTVSMMRRTTEQITDVSCGNTAGLVGIDQFH